MIRAEGSDIAVRKQILQDGTLLLSALESYFLVVGFDAASVN